MPVDFQPASRSDTPCVMLTSQAEAYIVHNGAAEHIANHLPMRALYTAARPMPTSQADAYHVHNRATDADVASRCVPCTQRRDRC